MRERAVFVKISLELELEQEGVMDDRWKSCVAIDGKE